MPIEYRCDLILWRFECTDGRTGMMGVKCDGASVGIIGETDTADKYI